ncbi:MAG TPA: pentapeptide repeat-containing protein [Anaerolineales bacterium]|nr:pentapeptide repeat-containing protein [Anaerolineales bacterium]HNQ95120.1 pentapeptide repeat-containing protein [Anaerolineales bacterium]HNS62620.1 pentapeptide repeat-containing protein [Anaerolineales bacterium]
MKSGWQKYLLYASIVIVGGFILFETVRLKNTGFEGKSLWDWMELLIIPLVLALGAFYLNRSERALERQIAEDRAKLERELATDHQQETALQSYLDRMTELLLENNLQAVKNEEVSNVARIRTLTVLRGLDRVRKGLVLLFLKESKLIQLKRPIVDLSGADFKDSDLILADLTNCYLLGVNFEGASLLGAYLQNSNLEGTNLHKADLRRADLSNAILMNAYLEDALVTTEQLKTAKTLKGTIMPDATTHK